jgi:hypothetical protein
MKSKVIILLYLIALSSGYLLNLHGRIQPQADKSQQKKDKVEKITLKDIGLTPTTESAFISSTKNVLHAIHLWTYYQATYLKNNEENESTLNNIISYRNKLKQIGACLFYKYGNLSLSKRFYELITEDRMASSVYETGVASAIINKNFSKQELIREESQYLKDTIDDYRNKYSDVIDVLCIYCHCSKAK